MLKFLNFFLLSYLIYGMNSYSAELDTNYFTFNISGSRAEVVHNETSSNPNFVTLNNKSKISTFTFQSGFAKEFFADSSISFAVGGEYGVLYGRSKDSLVALGLQYADKVVGTNYAFIGTVNANFEYEKMRFHPFAGVHFLKSKSDYKLSYTPISGPTSQKNIDYSEDGTQSFIAGGVRFFDQKTKLFSVICVEYEISSSFTKKLSAAKINGVSIQLSQLGEIKHAPARITLGFGTIF